MTGRGKKDTSKSRAVPAAPQKQVPPRKTPARTAFDLDELQRLIDLFDASNLAELEIEEAGRRVRLVSPRAVPPAHGTPPAHPAPVPPETADAPAAATEPASRFEAEGLVTIDAPMVGTFYTAPAPGEAPFVLPGDQVEDGQTVCIVEAMKILNEVPAKVPAIIERVLVENGEAVEYGQPLFAVRPIA
ncbi:MAG: acetyl-CoA carboxylase biotin carboxyl carrier protein [Candidatus Hydrogenedentota bacterium]